MLGFRVNKSLSSLIADKDAKAVRDNLGISGADELLAYYPRAYSKNGSGVDVAGAADGESVAVVGEVIDTRTSITRRGKQVTTLTIGDGRGRITASFFQSKWVARQLPAGTVAMFSGKLRYYRQAPQLQHPKYLVIARPGGGGGASGDEEADRIAARLAEMNFLPVYPQRKRITSWRILSAVDQLLRAIPEVPEPLDYRPDGMVSFDAALRGVHQPGPEGPTPAIRRLKYNEALTLALVMALRRADDEGRVAEAYPHVSGGQADGLVAGLDFELTGGQKQVVAEIADSLNSTRPMSRLLQGEVGSGKTIVSLIAMLTVVDGGAQCALLAPTEVLAAQHARSLTETLGRAGLSASVVVLTGSMPAKERKKALLAVVSGQADIVVGTHAIIEDAVEFYRLGLVVVDEQHRFGVEQRARLRDKGPDGVTPHLLVMTATPIPRSIAMTVFGDLAVSLLTELPGGRRPIATHVVPEAKPAWVERAWQRIREEVAAGHQAYVVCPRIDGEGGAVELHEQLATERYPDLEVGLLHGRLRPEEKDEVMADFAAGRIDVLVSTTVVEVGVDVANATVMLIREAENFGISQLHQLRGRVGRGRAASLCFLHTAATPDTPAGQAALDRIEGVAGTLDGLKLAELDLANRQEGDVLGTAQAGRADYVRLLNLLGDTRIIAQASRDAAKLVERDRALAERLCSEIAPEERGFLEKS
ncbi:ATP-dependent DNA helicase RecG [Corynebacterium otitidis]